MIDALHRQNECSEPTNDKVASARVSQVVVRVVLVVSQELRVSGW